MNGQIIEVSQANDVTGRRNVKLVLHEIHNDPSKYNKNGISWNEQYTLNNIDSVKGMPICVEFLDVEQSEPFGHGQSGIKDGQPLFEYSTVVGTFENGYVDTVEVNNKQIRALIGEGYIYEQRYPKFVQWLKAKMFDGDMPESSVEICAKKGNDVIIYDGGWKEQGRVPMVYDYTGHAIININPADDNAVLLELNSNNNKEVKSMKDEEKDTILELNQKMLEKNTEINQLQEETKVKDAKITELNSVINAKDGEITTLTSELNSTKEALVNKTTEFDQLTTEVNELREFKKQAMDKELINELNTTLGMLTDEEKSAAKEKIEMFSSSPSKEGIDEIVSEINAKIVEKVIESRKQAAHEQNNAKAEDIYSDVMSEVNSSISDDELY